jgi:hypothetical protein
MENIKESVKKNKFKLWRKKASSKIIIPVIIALIVSGITYGAKMAFGFVALDQKEIKANALKTLSLYERDINAHDFEAHRYFASNVTAFFDKYSTNPQEINTFWRTHFDKAFQNMRIHFDGSTVKVISTDDEGYNVSVIMCSDYYNIKKKKQINKEYSRYDLRLNEDFMICSLSQIFEGQ